MASSAADRLLGAGAGAGEELLLQQHHHPQMYYHVPQQSRREKLRFPLHEESPASTSLLLHDPSVGAEPPLFTPASNSLAIFHPSSAAAPSSYPHHHGFVATQFDGRAAAVPIPAQHQIQGLAGFSLSLSSASSPRPPAARPHLVSRPAPLGPFTGYATVVNRSRFLEPARKLLEEACRTGNRAAASTRQEMLLETQPPRAPSSVDHGMERLGDDDRETEEDRHVLGVDHLWTKATLISMLDEVCRRYRHYHQQVQTVITSFESVAGFSTAAPFISVALKVMSKHFRRLKHIISEQLSQADKNMISREDSSSFGLLTSRAYLQRTADTDGAFAQPNVWRPQRGLPERAVSVLRAWLFEHFLHPYPTDVDKQNLAKQTGLTRNQVSNWFINARVRLWKPMVEEIHSLEMHQKNKGSSAGDKEQQPQQPSSSKRNPGVNPQQFQIDQLRSSKAIQEHIPAPVPSRIQKEPPAQYACKDMMPGHLHIGAGGAAAVPSAGNSVSLTLGLHQHNGGGAGFPEPLPINVARRFGLEECGDSYLAGAFGGQERQLIGKGMGSRLFHEFVG